MRAPLATVILVGLVEAATAAQRGRVPTSPPRPPSTVLPAAAQMAILAAEDSRLVLPDDLHTPAIDTLRAKQMEDVRLLLELARSKDVSTHTRAVRALGRLERPEVIPDLLQYLITGPISETANAIAQAFHGAPLPNDTGGEQVEGALEALASAGAIPMDPTSRPGPIGPAALAIGRLPYEHADQVQSAESYLLRMIRASDSDPLLRQALPDITRGVEILARLRSRLAQLSSDTIEALRGIVINRRHEYPAPVRLNAMMALIAARGVDAETLRIGATAGGSTGDSTMQLRRLAAVVLSGAGAPVEPTERTELIAGLLADRSPIVRIEAVRAWGRQESSTNGCQRLLDAVKDPSVPVALVVIDTLGDQCKDDVNVTDRLTVEARTPAANDWHRESHALVALAKRAPGRAFIPLLAGHQQHATWQVRLYAARAAAITNEVSTLERLAFDRDDNVREATLAPLRRLKGDEAEPYFVAALARTDYQLLRTAANELKGAKPTPQLVAGLLDALRRVTAEKKETSRDTRLALLERLRELGDPEQAGSLVPLLRDFDIPVAQRAAALLLQWTGKAQEIDPQLLPRPAIPAAAELSTEPARVNLKSGKTFSIRLRGDLAPLTVARFVRLATAGYYNGLTFHRVVPNFVIQGGSPGANEYAGDRLYMRDEMSASSHERGTVGLSTRGRDTGDAQFFINLVDNPRLDFEYTIFGVASPLDVVDEIVEGDAIAGITFEKSEKEEKSEKSAEYRYATPGSSMRIVPASASASTLMPCASVHCGIPCPIIAPDQAGMPSGLMWSAKISSSASAPKLLSPGVHSEHVPNTNPAIFDSTPASFNCVSMRSMR
jgi:cyclophilin family peptidyl-prolyl cis-trans isomerase/HEAT repeat protein